MPSAYVINYYESELQTVVNEPTYNSKSCFISYVYYDSL